MGEPEKPKGEGKKNIVDVEVPGKSAPTSTSKPVIVSNRPVLKDPMVVEKGEKEPGSDDQKPAEKEELKRTGPPTIQPLEAPEPDDSSPKNSADKPEADAETPAPAVPDEPKTPEQPAEPVPSEDEKPAPETPEPEKTSSPDEDNDQVKPTTDAEKKLQAEEAERANHDAAIQELVDSGQYVLPIQSAKQKKARHFIVLGAILAVLLVLVWLDIALDAHIISLGGLHPVTHLFSN